MRLAEYFHVPAEFFLPTPEPAQKKEPELVTA